MHDREDDLQAAADKIGGHLFEASITLRVDHAPAQANAAEDRLRQLCGALGAFTRSRLATFQLPRKPNARSRRFLVSHEELATLWHPPPGVSDDRIELRKGPGANHPNG